MRKLPMCVLVIIGILAITATVVHSSENSLPLPIPKQAGTSSVVSQQAVRVGGGCRFLRYYNLSGIPGYWTYPNISGFGEFVSAVSIRMSVDKPKVLKSLKIGITPESGHPDLTVIIYKSTPANLPDESSPPILPSISVPYADLLTFPVVIAVPETPVEGEFHVALIADVDPGEELGILSDDGSSGNPLRSCVKTTSGWQFVASLVGVDHNFYIEAELCEPDLFMMDNEDDLGEEPNPWPGNYWTSKDIWVNQSATTTIPSGPIDPANYGKGSHTGAKFGADNYVHVRVLNRYDVRGEGKLRVYWAKAGTGLWWDICWKHFAPDLTSIGCPSGLILGDEVSGSPIPIDVEAGSEREYAIPWTDVPNPDDYACLYGSFTSHKAEHFCLLARIETEDTPPYGMTYPETGLVSKVTTNARYNNNIVSRNISIVKVEAGGTGSSAFLARNVLDAPTDLDLDFSMPDSGMGQISISVDLSSLADKPLPGLNGFTPTQDPDVFLMTGTTARLENIPMEPGEIRAIGVNFTHIQYMRPLADTDPPFVLDVAQYSDDPDWPDGGVTFEVTVVPPPITLRIEKAENVLQGHFTEVSLLAENSDLEMGGFDFLIAYDASALTFMEATPGQLLEDCGWEYFTYRYGVEGNCGDACPSGLLRIIAMAETNNGPNHPSCYGPPDTDPHELVSMKFLVTNDRTFNCQYAPIYFFWADCADNSISSIDGQDLYIDRTVSDFEGNLIWDEDDDVQFPEDARLEFVGAPDYCLNPDPDKPSAERYIDFIDGGIDIICSDSIDVKGDINCNGVPFEIADVVMLSNYFIYGLVAFDDHIECSIAASDVNSDGNPLSIADLVTLIRVITGDIPPDPRAIPETHEASVSALINHSAVAVSVNSPVDIGGGYFEFAYSGYDIGEPRVINGASDMTIKYSAENGVLKILVYSMEEGGRIPAGAENILAVPISGEGSISLTELELSDYFGNTLNLTVAEEPVLPGDYALYQNYPNPFNATTTIMYELPVAGHVSVAVYNVLGQKVATLCDREETAGIHSVEWNSTDDAGETVASGIYIYRIMAGKFTAERKLLLLK